MLSLVFAPMYTEMKVFPHSLCCKVLNLVCILKYWGRTEFQLSAWPHPLHFALYSYMISMILISSEFQWDVRHIFFNFIYSLERETVRKSKRGRKSAGEADSPWSWGPNAQGWTADVITHIQPNPGGPAACRMGNTLVRKAPVSARPMQNYWLHKINAQ